MNVDFIICGKNEFDMCTINLNDIEHTLRETRESITSLERGVLHKTLKINNTTFSTNETSTVNGVGYILHHIDSKNIAHILPVSRAR